MKQDVFDRLKMEQDVFDRFQNGGVEIRVTETGQITRGRARRITVEQEVVVAELEHLSGEGFGARPRRKVLLKERLFTKQSSRELVLFFRDESGALCLMTLTPPLRS